MNQDQVRKVTRAAIYGVGIMEEKVEAVCARNKCAGLHEPILHLCQATSSIDILAKAFLPDELEELMAVEMAQVMTSIGTILRNLGQDQVLDAIFEAEGVVHKCAFDMRDSIEKVLNK